MFAYHRPSHHHFNLVFVGVLACSLVYSLSVRAQESAGTQELPAKPLQLELIQEVMEGKREEALASWWGFDTDDSTEMLQKAINSKVKRLIIDRQPTPWITRPLTGVSNQEIVFQQGVELVAKRGAFKAKGDCLLSFREGENIVLRGEQGGEDQGGSHTNRSLPRIRMHKKDYQSKDYDKSEWRHGIALYGCRNVKIQDLAIEQTGGDAIYLGAGSNFKPNHDIVIQRVDCNENHRQGISVISAVDLLIEDCLLRNTQGTAPEAGIDFEPNHPEDVLVRCVMRRCTAEGNAGTGFQICPQFMTSRSAEFSILIEDCVSRSNRQHAVHLVGNPNDPPNGTLQINRLLAENDGMAGLSVQFNPFDAVRIELTDSIFNDCAKEERFFPPLYLQGLNDKGRAAGNLHIRNLRVKDENDRTVFRIRDRIGNGISQLTGDITLQRSGAVQKISIDEDWIREHVETK